MDPRNPGRFVSLGQALLKLEMPRRPEGVPTKNTICPNYEARARNLFGAERWVDHWADQPRVNPKHVNKRKSRITFCKPNAAGVNISLQRSTGYQARMVILIRRVWNLISK
jgi:hypothetical protein